MTSIAVCAKAPYTVQPYSARRARHISGSERLSAMLLGSPSVRRANGGSEAGFLPRALRTASWYARRAQTPIFEIDRLGSPVAERLPRIWITEPAHDERTGAYVGRTYVGVYPCDHDHGGWRALELAEHYCGEARTYEGAYARTMRVECYRAAEILLLHSAWRGNVEACARLGALYMNDACEGAYWKGLLEQGARHAVCAAPDERAFAWLSHAALHGHAQACCNLGDLLSSGRGCTCDLSRARQLYRRAYDACVRKGDVGSRAQAGEAALRLARCSERAWGCAQSFEAALSWYRIAEDLLKCAVEDGAWSCKRSYSQATTGVRCMLQEINGCY